MRSYGSPSSEISVILTDEETEKLGQDKLRGRIRIKDRQKTLERCLEISIGNPEGACIDLDAVPRGVGYPNIMLYSVNLSREAYEELRKHGTVSDRVGMIGKVTISKKSYIWHF